MKIIKDLKTVFAGFAKDCEKYLPTNVITLRS